MNEPPENGAQSYGPAVRVGQVIGGRYVVQSLLGRGGMGLVYAALHQLTQRRVALKVVDTNHADVNALRDRFLGEARTAAAVRHPNIVDILDMGMHGNAPYLVMELLEGQPLEALLEESAPLPLPQTLAWLLPVMGALETLHIASIVHRDIKPSNIFLSTVNHAVIPKLLDFGLARAASDSRHTRSGVVIGTPIYMAPEHAAGAQVGPAADIWSMGVVLFECLTGEVPFNSTDKSVQAAQLLAGHVRPIRQVRPDLPLPIADAIDQALQRDLGRRHSSMKAFARALVDGAVASKIPLPDHVDSIGLPDYARWRQAAEARHGSVALAATQTTHELLSGPRDHSSRPVAGPRESGPSARVGSGSRRTLSFAVVAFVLLGALGFLAWQHRQPASTVFVPRTQPSSNAGSAPILQPRVDSLAAEQPDQRDQTRPTAHPTAPLPEAGTRRTSRPHRAHTRQPKSTQPPAEVETEWK